ncbi:hypothetical protein PsAD37_00549 [Pseudovibrio sp. Ad37]|nr:hypothetical protein PsAD37_00549 [Pseudovibrio sp. Ad37]
MKRFTLFVSFLFFFCSPFTSLAKGPFGITPETDPSTLGRCAETKYIWLCIDVPKKLCLPT